MLKWVVQETPMVSAWTLKASMRKNDNLLTSLEIARKQNITIHVMCKQKPG